MGALPALCSALGAADHKFEARVYEKAEHWHFDTTIEAKDETDAYRILKKEYPQKEYTIQSVRAI